MHTKLNSFFVVGIFIMMTPVTVFAESADQRALIQQLTANVAALQAQIDALRQTGASLSAGALSSSAESPATLPRAAAVVDSVESAGALPTRPAMSSSTGGESGDEGPEAIVSFDRNLYLGLRNDPDVSNLQEFLADQGFYNNIISGNFFILTRNAVKKFQSSHGIKPSGYFGSLTRAVANKILSGAGNKETRMNPGPQQTNGFLKIDPSSATLKVGDRISVKAIFAPPRPACLGYARPCEIAEISPYEVYVLFISDNPDIAVVDKIEDTSCDPPRMCPVSVPQYAVRGVSPGTATISATHTNNGNSFTATITVRVIGAVDASGSLYIEPSSALLKVGEAVSIQALFQAPCPVNMACIQSLQNVAASFASDNPSIAAVDTVEDKTCAPPRMCPVALNKYAVRGVSAGDAVITASYVDNQKTYTAKMKVTVAASSLAAVDCAKEPAGSQNACWQTAAQQKGDISLCRNITVPNAFFSRDSCINAVAQAKKDSTLCASIADASVRRGCVSGVASGGFFPFPLPSAPSIP